MIEWWNNQIPWKRILNSEKGNIREMKMGKELMDRLMDIYECSFYKEQIYKKSFNIIAVSSYPMQTPH